MYTEIVIPTLANSSIRVEKLTPVYAFTGSAVHIHDECEICLMYEGELCFIVNDDEYQLEAGDIIFINGRIPHGSRVTEGSLAFLIHAGFDSDFYNIGKIPMRLLNHISADTAFFKSGTETNIQLRACLESILTEITNQNKAYDKFIKAEMSKFFAILCRENILKDSQDYFDSKSIGRIMPVLAHIDEHYKEIITLDSMSAMLKINKTHFCRIFKNAVNTSFISYLNFVRVCKAEKLLLSTDKSIAEIACETGFSSPVYFAETFRQNMGCAPSKYKNIKSAGVNMR